MRYVSFERLRAGVFFVFAFLFSQPLFSNDEKGGHADADKGVKVAFGLMVVGRVDLKTAILMPAPPPVKIPLILAALEEMEGARQAIEKNAQTKREVGQPEPGGGLGGLSGTNLDSLLNIAEQCKAAGDGCTCGADPKCSNPQISMPSIQSIKDSFGDYKGDEKDVNGVSLADALGQLDNAYAKAVAGAEKFNEGAAAVFGGGGGSANNSLLASSASEEDSFGSVAAKPKSEPDTGKDSGYVDGKDNPQALANGLEPGGLNLALLIKKAYHERGPRMLVVADNGLNVKSTYTGRDLSIFERTTRAIRSITNVKDILLAKTEFVRKEYLKKSEAVAKWTYTIEATPI